MPRAETAPQSQPAPLPALVGSLWVPAWAVRPGSYRALSRIAKATPTWLLLHSRNSDFWKPCYHNREQLGRTIGVSRSTISRALKILRKAHLLFELERGIEDKSKRHRPPARWALDPFAADIWRPKVEEAICRIAEDDGQDGRWVQRAMTSLDAFERRSRILAAAIADDMPFAPKPRRRKKRKKHRATTDPEPWAQLEP